jgi:hypothetical protein
MTRKPDDFCLDILAKLREMPSFGSDVPELEIVRCTMMIMLDNLEIRIKENQKLRAIFARIKDDAQREVTAESDIVFDGFRDGYRRYAMDILHEVAKAEVIEGWMTTA